MKHTVLVIWIPLLLLAGCGSGSSTAVTSPTTVDVAQLAGDTPSKSARMICNPEGKEAIAGALGVDTVVPLVPTWNVKDHVYACTYHYAGGAYMTLSVKEASGVSETTAYFDQLARERGKTVSLSIPGAQGAFVTGNGSAVVRKDFKVLLVDVGHLPGSFGAPAASRSDNSSNAAFAIMGCWTDA